MITDLLPAGFEIDNPNLVNSAQHDEFRLDRRDLRCPYSNSATTASSPPSTAQPATTANSTLAYVVRAVTPGTYDHPAANVEDMYRPELSARTATGKMEVVTAQP